MKTDLQEACGVWIEFLDEQGNTVAQQVIDEWHGRPVPQRGDELHFDEVVGARKCRGTVIARRFDMQYSVDGAPQLWVRLVVRATAETAAQASRLARRAFSTN